MATTNFTIANKYVTTLSFQLPWYQGWTDVITNKVLLEGGLSLPGVRAVGDFNNDNLDDIVIHFGDVLIKPIVLLSNGDGTFLKKRPYKLIMGIARPKYEA